MNLGDLVRIKPKYADTKEHWVLFLNPTGTPTPDVDIVGRFYSNQVGIVMESRENPEQPSIHETQVFVGSIIGWIPSGMLCKVGEE
jgi:hypothetical protein